MRLYKTTYVDDALNVLAGTEPAELSVWDGTLSDASKQRVTLKKDGMREISTKEVDVPTDKAGLMAFLNGLVAS